MAKFPVNINRLNLPNMVDNQLKDTVVPNETYFNPVFFDNSAARKHVSYTQNLPARTNIETSFNSIVATVHNNLRNRELRIQRSKPEVAKIDLTIPDTKPAADSALQAKTVIPLSSTKEPLPLSSTTAPLPSTLTKASLALSAKAQLPSQSTKILAPPFKVANRPISKGKSISESEHKLTIAKPRLVEQFGMPLRANSIPQLKAIREQRSVQRMRRNIGRVEEMTDYMRRKRMNEVVQQKRILEDMLQQHYKLQRDRQTIAVEIQTMRENLNHIRDRLDMSLKKLNTKCTVAERSPRQKNNINQNRFRNAQRPVATNLQR